MIRVRNKSSGKIYDLGKHGLLSWVGKGIAFHMVVPSEISGVDIDIFSPSIDLQDVQYDAKEIKPVCPTCGKERA